MALLHFKLRGILLFMEFNLHVAMKVTQQPDPSTPNHAKQSFHGLQSLVRMELSRETKHTTGGCGISPCKASFGPGENFCQEVRQVPIFSVDCVSKKTTVKDVPHVCLISTLAYVIGPSLS